MNNNYYNKTLCTLALISFGMLAHSDDSKIEYHIKGGSSLIFKSGFENLPPANIFSKNFPSQINLSWDDSVNTNSVTYKVHRDSGSGYQEIATTQLQGYQDKGLNPETTFNYKIFYNSGGGDIELPDTTIIASTTKRKIKLQVYEKSGNTIASFPVKAFIPLPYGVYFQNQNELNAAFVIKDSLNNPVTAQFLVKSRWHNKDNSIKEIEVIFKASNIPANAGRGQSGDPLAVEYFFEEGITPAPINPVAVSESPSLITISNEHLSFDINKTNFNFIDKVTFKGTDIINNSVSDGSYLVNLYDNLYLESQPCNALMPTVFEVEENGPVRARIRVERPAHFITNSSDGCFATFGSVLKENIPGFVVWFDLYYDSKRIEVNYNMLNNAITSYDTATATNGEALDGWILFFQEMGIKFSLATANNIYKYSANGNELDVVVDNSLIIQSDKTNLIVDNVLAANTSGAALRVYSNSAAKGFRIIDPFFKYTTPNGWSVDKINNQVSLLISPDGCDKCESSIGYGDTGLNSPSQVASDIDEFLPSNSGLYALNDLTILPKHFYLDFFETDTGSIADILLNPPNIVLSTQDYNSIGSTTDLFGIKTELVQQNENSANFDIEDFEANQHVFGVNLYRRRSCTTGGIAPSAHNFYMRRPPEINHLAIEMYDDLLRPQVLPKYWSGSATITPYKSRTATNPDTHSTFTDLIGYDVAAFNLISYCKNYSIRSFDIGPNPSNIIIDGITYVVGGPKTYSLFVDKDFPPSFNFVITGIASNGFYINRSPTVYPRDDAHMWVQKLYDAPVDNPMLSYFKRRYESYLNTYTKHQYTGGNARGIGHSLIAQVDSYLESGNNETLNGINEVMDMVLSKMQDSGATHKHSIQGVTNKQYGISFMEGYLMHGILNVLMSVQKDSVIYTKAHDLLFGGGTYRVGLPGLVDAAISTKFGYKDVTNCETNPITINRVPRCLASSGGSVTLNDPLVIAAYLLMEQDPTKAMQIITHLKHYLVGDYGSQPSKIPVDVISYNWNGNSYNRAAIILNNLSETSVKKWLDQINHIEGGGTL